MSRVRYPVRPLIFVSPPADSRRAIGIYWRKDVLLVLVNRLGDLSLPRNGVIRLTDHPDMPMHVKEQNNNNRFIFLDLACH